MRPREKTAAEIAEVGRPVLAAKMGRQERDTILRDALAEARENGPKVEEEWQRRFGAASLVNYAAAPAGGAVYDSAWLANNTTGR